jgi:N-acetylglutamate synthase-like GNAT family acetyltransferase
MAAEKPGGTAKTGIIHMGKNLPIQALDIAHIKPNAENYADFLENLQMSFNTNDEILPYFFRALKNDEKKLEIIYARIENEIAGWCAFTNDAENNLLEMAALYIRPAYRRTGIATEIFDKLENETEKNSRKIRFYAPEEKDSKSSPAYMDFFSSRGYRDTTTLLNRYLGKIKHVKKELSK